MNAFRVRTLVFLVYLGFVGCGSYPETPPGFIYGYPTGPSNGIVGDTLDFKVCAVSECEEDVSYAMDWGDSSSCTWSALYQSGLEVTLQHVYSEAGLFRIRGRARASAKLVSEWSDSILVLVQLQKSGDTRW